MLAGSYPGAIETLHHALAAAPAGSLTYAYALYDLGRSLLLSGDPKAAVPVLEQRLKFPDQTPVVQQLLDQALRASGSAPARTGDSGAASIPSQQSRGTAGRGSGGTAVTPGSGPGNGQHGSRGG